MDVDMGERSRDPLGVLLGPLTGLTEDSHDHSRYALRALLLTIMIKVSMPYVPFCSQP